MSIVKKVILGFILVFISGFIYVWIEMSSSANQHFVNSEAFNITVLYILSDSTLSNSRGEVIEIDSSVAGHLYDEESARLVFDIKTAKEDITVAADLSYDQGNWLIKSIEYK